ALEKAGPEVCYLERLAVLPEHRGKGCGKMLVEHVFDKAAQNGSKRVEIGIISEDTKLRDWYERFGFVLKSTKTFDHLPFVVAFMAAQRSTQAISLQSFEMRRCCRMIRCKQSPER
ncbi:MAG: GNAT family N-acetyltransferase, partial [Planctomycetota bacterium]